MEILKVFFIIECVLLLVVYQLIFYKNMWILHSDNPDKYKWFLFNPFLQLDSIFTFSWNEKVGKNRNLKKSVNKLSKFLGMLIILILLTEIIVLFI